MREKDQAKQEVDQFLLGEIDTVPHLEALLLVWNSRPKQWSLQDLAHGLFLTPDATLEILRDLTRRNLLTAVSGTLDTYTYNSVPGKDQLIALVDATYRKELIRLSRLIHSKPSAAVREFARAFRFKKEQE